MKKPRTGGEEAVTEEKGRVRRNRHGILKVEHLDAKKLKGKLSGLGGGIFLKIMNTMCQGEKELRENAHGPDKDTHVSKSEEGGGMGGGGEGPSR